MNEKITEIKEGQRLKIFDLEFEIIEKIGSGGFGDVWSLKNTKNGNKVVMKCQNSDTDKKTMITTRTKDELYHRFIQEAETFIELEHHTNIAYFYGIEKIANRIAIIMEFVSGRSLDQWLDKAKINEWNKILTIAIQICKALAHSHSYGIIQRFKT